MAKKKFKINMGMIFALVSAILALVAFFLMAAPSATLNEKTAYTGAQMTFGYRQDDVEIFLFSFGNLVPYLLIVIGLVFNALSFKCKYANIISAVCYLVAGIMFFLVITMCVLGDGASLILGIGGLLSGKESGKDLLSLGAGAIVSGILSILSAVVSGATLVLKK